ncbi:MAG TPA: YkgJ family cysteine cluster protein [Candidatus Gastranaerophilales bacterium]|nr:YkgJ family cysteine cluster protein [Candidatus Gastranaerophilales bacterium]
MELCKTCHGGCCRRYNIDIWGSDIIRICETLKVDINFFTDVIPVSEENAKILMGKEAVFIFTDTGKQQHYRLILKSNESKFYPGASKCMFLQEWSADLLKSEELSGIIGRCGIYSCRPIACRAYPAKYDYQEKDVIIRDPFLVLEKEHKTASDNSAYKICARALTSDDYNNFKESYFADAITYYHEKEFFIKTAEKWNKNPDVSDNFYKFILNEYNNARIKLFGSDKQIT